MKQYGIIGYPLGHSLSPLVHNRAFADLGVDASYEAWPTPPGELEAFMAAARARPIAGLSVTIPHKTGVAAYLDGVSAGAARAGAVNTVYWRAGRLLGENTDVSGFVAPLAALPRLPSSALVLGAGGAARAVLAGLAGLGVKRVTLTNRNPDKAEALAREFAVEAAPWDARGEIRADLIVNATPLGMAGPDVLETPYPAQRFTPGAIAYDLIYNPGQTRFLREAAAAGCAVIGGLDMFVEQAAGQFKLWTGLELPRRTTREILEEALTKGCAPGPRPPGAKGLCPLDPHRGR
ncbi:MAG: shikimate dehydrogenase [Desulfovibrionaceae bacterium]|nr:shikimate dehydrogenase [Desulfovibrionaceae bacterium]MBF0515399.1 shikimate dehydrogenase [Desulfovibrionaceae bacterium]